MGAYFVNIPQPCDRKSEARLRLARQPDRKGVIAKAGRRVEVNINGASLTPAGVKRSAHHQIQLPVQSFIQLQHHIRKANTYLSPFRSTDASVYPKDEPNCSPFSTASTLNSVSGFALE